MTHAFIVRTRVSRQQGGIVLLEALIAIVIFAIGILGLIGLQASSAKEATNAKYRTDASLLVDQLIGKMWVSDRDATRLAAAFASPNGTEYLKWKGASNQLGSVLKTLPQKTGTDATPAPTVSITSVSGGTSSAPQSSLVKVTVYWQAPYEDVRHQYVVVTRIR